MRTLPKNADLERGFDFIIKRKGTIKIIHFKTYEEAIDYQRESKRVMTYYLKEEI